MRDAWYSGAMERVAALEAARAGYDDDFYAWTGSQAALLRAGALHDADIENIAEEIESLGKSVRAGLRSQFARIIEHLLKLRLSPAELPRRGWTESIIRAQGEIVSGIEDNPSLRRQLPTLLEQAHRQGKSYAKLGLIEHGELDDAAEAKIDDANFTLEEAMKGWLDQL